MCISNPFATESDKIGKKFSASFSGGKDSMLAIYRCIKSGMIPVEMLTTCPVDAEQSWFHKVPEHTLYAVSEAVNIPLRLIKTTGDEYRANFEKALTESKEKGAEYAVFGDIDIEGHLEWCFDRCNAVGITAFFPLWKEKRADIVREFIDSGFKAKIIVARHEKLQEGFLGELLTHELLDKIAATGVDICGENGEYHTLVVDGPIFRSPVTEKNQPE